MRTSNARAVVTKRCLERVTTKYVRVCFWHDDGQDDQDADVVRGGPNYELSLTAARANYKRIGASAERVLKHVRKPLHSEL